MQTNSYLVAREKRNDHERLMKQFRQTLLRLGCDQFEVYEQVDPSWNPVEGNNRFVQVMRFRDRWHHQAVQRAEREDLVAQELIRQFLSLIDYPSQRERGQFVSGHYTGLLSVSGGSSAPQQGDGGTVMQKGEQPSLAPGIDDPLPPAREAEPPGSVSGR